MFFMELKTGDTLGAIVNYHTPVSIKDGIVIGKFKLRNGTEAKSNTFAKSTK